VKYAPIVNDFELKLWLNTLNVILKTSNHEIRKGLYDEMAAKIIIKK